MPCFWPMTGYRSRELTATGKRKVVFNRRDAKWVDKDVLSLPCGQCIGCRLERSRQWAIRAMHEASLYDRNCFLTLTYSPQHLPKGGSLVPEDIVLFMKRVRRAYDHKIRSFGCGEYGERLGRPHYHLLLFNHDWPDKQLLTRRGNFPLYTSEELSELWGKGQCSSGGVTFESAAYVARYVTKKISGDATEAHYGARLPERTVAVSRRPGLGADWLRRFHSDVYPSDSVLVDGRMVKPPKYYDNLFSLDEPDLMEKVKRAREKKALANAADNTPDRLDVRERIQYAKFNQLIRGFENATETLHGVRF